MKIVTHVVLVHSCLGLVLDWGCGVKGILAPKVQGVCVSLIIESESAIPEGSLDLHSQGNVKHVLFLFLDQRDSLESGVPSFLFSIGGF